MNYKFPDIIRKLVKEHGSYVALAAKLGHGKGTAEMIRTWHNWQDTDRFPTSPYLENFCRVFGLNYIEMQEDVNRAREEKQFRDMVEDNTGKS